MATRLEQRELAAEVDVEVLERLQIAAGRARVTREVEDHARALDGLVHQSPIPQITLEVAPTLPSPRGGGRISRATQGADIRAGGAEGAHQVEPEKAGTARHENAFSRVEGGFLHPPPCPPPEGEGISMRKIAVVFW